VLVVLALSAIAWVSAQHGQRQGLLTYEDRVGIEHLYAQYNETIDNGDIDGWIATWAPDADFNGYKGRDGLRRFATDYIRNRDGARRRHWLNNLVMHPMPDGARVTNSFMILDVSVTPPAVASTGRNIDTFAKTADGWRFKSRTTFRPDGSKLEPPRPPA
jgi:hypothetical protein